MAAFEILAAIDLRGGRVVRLVEGDFDRETAYSDDPVATAEKLVGQGSRWLHVVDLDGARAGLPVQREMVASIADAVRGRARVEVGGGVRNLDAASEYLAVGLDRVVIGTAALTSDLAAEVVRSFGADRLAVALDIRGGDAVGGAWQTGAESASFESAIDRLVDAGAATFEVTAIERDGTLLGPDLELLERVRVRARGADVIASAGIRNLDDLRAVRDLGCAGAIVGRAIYEASLDLASMNAAITSLG